MGFNVFSVNFDNASHKFDGDSHHQPYAPLLLINVQKLWTLCPFWDFSVGTQSGFSSIRNWVSYDYANFSYHNEKLHTQWVLGTYTSTNGFFGPETRGLSTNSFVKYIGLQTGLEQILWKDKLSVQADFLSGRHSVGELVLGGAYYYRPDIVFSAGYQMPTCKSTSVQALVVEFTYNPGAENKKKHTRRMRV